MTPRRIRWFLSLQDVLLTTTAHIARGTLSLSLLSTAVYTDLGQPELRVLRELVGTLNVWVPAYFSIFTLWRWIYCFPTLGRYQNKRLQYSSGKFDCLMMVDSFEKKLNPMPLREKQETLEWHIWCLFGKEAWRCECEERRASLALTSFVYICQVPNLIDYQLQTLRYSPLQQLVDKKLVLSTVDR
jgi:hypothetical protein